jgi:hypothetical protein
VPDPIKQYVNLPYDAAEHRGSRIVYEVTATDVSDEDNVRSEWWVEATGDDNTDPKYLSSRQRARPRRTYVRNRRDKFRNTVHLPHVGGDRYTVKCSKMGDRSEPVEQEEIETWRKLFITVHYMNDDCKKMYDDLKDDFIQVYEDAFIEWEEVAKNQTRRDEPRTRSTNALTHLYDRRPRLSNRPFHLRLVILNDIYSPVTRSGLHRNVGMVVFHLDLNTPLLNGEARDVRACKIRFGRGSWKNIKRYIDIPNDERINFDLSGYAYAADKVAAGETFTLRLSYRGRSHYLGHSIGNFCCLRINEAGTEEERKTTILQTFTHEIGHGCQQVVRRERLHDDRGRRRGWENNPTWYNDRWGGQGPHCNTNARLEPTPPDRDATGTRSGQEYEHDPGSGDLCTMFHKDESHVNADGAFCDSCKPRLMRVDLGRSNMRRQGWMRY